MTHLKSLEKFLLAKVAAEMGKKSLDPDEDLLDQNIIDSLGLLKLVTFLEQSHGIQVLDEDIVPENFETLNAIARLVEKKIIRKMPIWPEQGSPTRDIQPKPTIVSQAALPMMPDLQ